MIGKEKLLAQIVNPVIPQGIGSGPKEQGAIATGGFIGSIIGVLFIFAFFSAIIYLITGGYYWITSGGDKTNLESARNRITHAILGLIVVASVWAIMNLVGPFLGISFPNLPFPTIESLVR
jgi:hypothetical protein